MPANHSHTFSFKGDEFSMRFSSGKWIISHCRSNYFGPSSYVVSGGIDYLTSCLADNQEYEKRIALGRILFEQKIRKYLITGINN